ncbi:MAG: type II secretion system protein GspG [Planctomycetes bacterium]|nr:type II secretion system protein GspG [Planctomycetota bacterium]
MRTQSPGCSPGLSRQSGFTLVEVIVVLSVILLLTGIAVPMLSSYMEDGRRARAESECKTLGAAVMSFYKDVGTYPSRNASGTDNTRYTLVTGTAVPTSNPWTATSTWQTWAMSSTYGDTLDNHLLTNTPGGQTSAAYATTGNMRWRGPYTSGMAPLDPWGRPYVVNVISGWYSHATNYKRIWVLSAGPDGTFSTNSLATKTTEITGDDIGMMISQKN